MSTRVDLPPPIADDIFEGGGGSEWVHLITARHDIDAHLLEGRLREAGIEARKVKDRGAPGAWLYGGSNPWAPVNILVRKLQLEDARVVLAEISWDGPTHDELTARGSQRRSSFGLVWWATALILGCVLIVLTLNQLARSTIPCQLPVLCGESATP
ncbi:MAG: DUF2007 domain-containing protein [Actinomycetota bacterium]